MNVCVCVCVCVFTGPRGRVRGPPRRGKKRRREKSQGKEEEKQRGETEAAGWGWGCRGAGDRSGRDPGPLALAAQAWPHLGQWLVLADLLPTKSQPPRAGQPLQCSTLGMAGPLTSVMAPEGYSSPRQCQPWSFEAELVLKPSLRRVAPLRAVRVQE